MKIVDAAWEKRNLGVSCSEIALSAEDSFEQLEAAVSGLDSEYIVLKAPVSSPQFIFSVYSLGFVYVEDSIPLVRNLDHLEYSPMLHRLAEQTSVELISDIDLLLCEVRKGMFDTDRVSLDPQFTKEMAANRFAGWILDEHRCGTQFYNYIWKGKAIGFFALRDAGNGIYDSVLGGLYVDYRKLPLGNILNYKIFELAAQLGGKQLCTTVSTNNSVQLRSLLACGYMISDIFHVYVLHRNHGTKDEKIC